MKTIWLIGFACVILCSCGTTKKANRHIRIAERHIRKAEILGSTWNVDTVFTKVMVRVPEIHKDTIFNSVKGDTVIINKDKLVVKYVRLPGDSVYIQGECASDTIYQEVPITVTKVLQTRDKWKTPALAMAGILFLLLISGLSFTYFKGKN